MKAVCLLQMLAFIQAQPSIVERILRHIETPSFVDLLFRVIQLDEYPAGAGVLEVCHYLHYAPRRAPLDVKACSGSLRKS